MIKLASIIRVIIYLFIFFASWTNSFAITEKINLPNLFLLLLLLLSVPYFLLRKHIILSALRSEDLLLVSCFFGVIFSGLISPNVKTVNYILAYLFTFFIIYLFFKIIIYSVSDIDTLLKVNFYSVSFVCIFILLEFSLNYFYGFDLQEIVPRSVDANATYLSSLPRSYGFSNEPTNVAFYLNCLGPIALWTLWKKFKIKTLFKLLITLLFFLGLITTFSAAGFAFIFLSMLLFTLLNYILRPKSILKHGVKFFSLLFVFVFVFNLAFFYKDSVYLSPLYAKISLNQDQENSRQDRWQRDFELAVQSPIFGQGMGYSSSQGRGSSVNWYLFLLSEGGTAALLPLLAFLVFFAWRILSSNVQGRFFFGVGYLASLMHLFVVSTFYDPFLWILVSLFVFSEQSRRNTNYIGPTVYGCILPKLEMEKHT